MITTIHPPLEGLAAERFLALAKQLSRGQERRISAEFDTLLENEIDWLRSYPHLNGGRGTYEASARILIDLARLRWAIKIKGYEIELCSPQFRPDQHVTPEDILNNKKVVRYELNTHREQQLRIPAVRQFITRLENPPSHNSRKSIHNLIANGQELFNRIQPAITARGEDRVRLLEDVIKPYLQLVPDENEPTCKDEFTGILLGDVWRYFRYTWVLPQLSIPGRQLLYLIRDAAHPCHAVMGIAALNNSAMQMKERDKFIGWTFNSFAEKTIKIIKEPNASSELIKIIDLLEDNITFALSNLEPEGLVKKQEIENPSLKVVTRLRNKSEEFGRLREDALRELLAGNNQPYVLEETETISEGLPPVSDEVLMLEGKTMSSRALVDSRRMLVAKKRAFEYSRLLMARYQLRLYRKDFINPSSTKKLLSQEDFTIAVNTSLLSNKSAKIGSNMLEITTCGAIKPYNHLLSGKLTSLLLLSPQIATDYNRRYGNKPSIISSQLKNTPVQRDTTLAYLGTTSLYARGSSQYERLKLPEKIISINQEELKYNNIGFTSGYGTVQFSPDTVRSIEKVLEEKLGFQNVNSIFGEGPSPRLRKLRVGLEELGFDPELLMRHNQQRIIYAIPLFKDACRFLLGEPASLPDYINNPENYPEASNKISAFWRERWLASRLNHEQTMINLSLTKDWALSEELPSESFEDKPNDSFFRKQDDNSAKVKAFKEGFDIDFWRSLAFAGPNVCADQLSGDQIARLHIKQPIEDYIINKIEDGYSVVLTGNAGDGKTHLQRRLEQQLAKYNVHFQFDATAIPDGNINYIIDEWKQSIADGKPYCLAANEFILYALRKKSNGSSKFSILKELDRQCRYRLAYSFDYNKSEEALDKVIVIDLSLRNPLSSSFVKQVIQRILEDPSLIEYSISGIEPNFTRNFNRLNNTIVFDRLINLFNRIVQRGYRAPIRELWIVLLRLLFGSTPNDSPDALSPKTWYSERLFEQDDRFTLMKLLRRYCDPARSSHPQWDMILEKPGSTLPTDWCIDNQEPIYSLSRDQEPRFDAVKRAFYFEHRCGNSAFDLEDEATQQFQGILNAAEKPDDILKRDIIERINACYCPRRFSSMKDALYLWVGHRFHEKPTRSYLANQSISSRQFEILLPHLPARLNKALDYSPDHFILRFTQNSKMVNLRIDYSLFKTLHMLGDGMPRHLMPEKDINRLDVFLEQLQSMDINKERVFVSFNTEHRSVSRIKLSSDWRKYEEVSDHE